jgi:hypothetical protein
MGSNTKLDKSALLAASLFSPTAAYTDKPSTPVYRAPISDELSIDVVLFDGV